MWHIFAISGCVLLSKQFNVNLNVSLWLFTVGILFFAGSIFLLSTIPVHGMESVKAIGLVTPIGGLILVAAWLSVAVQFIRNK